MWLNVRRARLAVFIVYVACPLFCLPALFTFTIKPREAATHLISSPGLPSIGPGFDSSSVELIDWLTRLPPPPSPPPPSSTWSETSKMNGRPLSTDQDQETSWWTDLGPDPPLIHIYPLSTPPLSIPFPAFSLPVTVSLNLSDLSSVDIDRLRSFLVPIPSLTYRVTFSDVAIAHNQLLNRLNFWLYSVLTKLVPCVALTFLSVALIRLLCHANFRRNRLLRLRTHRPVVVRACSLASHTSSLRPTSTVAPVSSASLPSHLAPPVPTSVCSSTSIGLANVHPNHQHHQHDAATCPHHSSQRLSIRSSSDSILPSLGPSKHVLTFNLSPAVSLNNTRTTSLRPTVSVTSRPCPLQSNPTVSFEQATNRTIKLRTNQRASMDGNLFAVATSHTSGQSTSGTSNTTANVNCDRSTRMLICILVLFLLTEFPSGLLALLSAILGKQTNVHLVRFAMLLSFECSSFRFTVVSHYTRPTQFGLSHFRFMLACSCSSSFAFYLTACLSFDAEHHCIRAPSNPFSVYSGFGPEPSVVQQANCSSTTCTTIWAK